MTEQSEQLRQALLAIKQLRTRLDRVEQARAEPIAIIGVGCRFPGQASNPERFWQLLNEGRDAVTEVPADRWESNGLYDPDTATPGKMNSRWGAFLDRVDQFDPAFFGISPREAAYMDPQQRLLLEVAFEALEDAGQPLDRLAGSPTGIFAGIHSHSNDYAWFQLAHLEGIDAHTATGTAHSIVANRLSYCFDFNGPSLAVDSACSSSLVAVHLACESLRNGECTLALAGGANLILSPEASVTFSKLQMLAPDGRCKTFDARADGFVRGEGCGLIVLKRLSDALQADDPILALIVGSAINQDGRTNGLTAPNGRAQQAVIRQAIENARIDPGQISYVETHGTGTALGDPIEVEALAEILGRSETSSDPCVLGSVKTNIGHLEAAAGIAGLIKAVLALNRQVIPRSLHFQALNPHITLEGTRFVIADHEQPWPADKPRYAGISSFGFGGTNAHVILQEAPPAPGTPPVEATPGVALLPISAHNEQARHDLARNYRQRLAGEPVSVPDLCYALSRRRTHHAHRLAISGTSASDLIDRLDTFLRGDSHPDIATGKQLPASQRALCFVFSGQGPQWPGMGRGLLEAEPVFRARIETVDELLQPYAGWSLLEALTAGEARSRLHETEVAQPALFALQVALADLWQSWGITPDAVVGHSAGEVAAAHVAGMLSLPDAVRVIFHRARLMQQATGRGRMVAVALPAPEAEALLPPYQGRVSLAAINGPTSTVLSGDPEDIEAIAASLQARGIFARLLPGRYAFHSDQMTPYQEALVEALDGMTVQPATLPIYSTVTGAPATPEDFGATYWGRNIREPVRFAGAIAALLERGYSHAIEISPHPVLAHSILDCAGDVDQMLVLPSLQRNAEERAVLARGLATLYTRGFPIRWDRLYPTGRIPPRLPTYPWQRKRYWLKARESAGYRPIDGQSRQATHPLLARRLRAPLPLFENEFDLNHLPYLRDHRLYDRSVMPAAAYIEMVLAAADALPGTGMPQLTNLALHAVLPLPEEGARTVQLLLTPGEPSRTTFQIYSDDRAGDDWTLHASGTVLRAPVSNMTDRSAPLAELQERCRESSVTDHYRHLEAQGFHFGAAFQGIEKLWVGEGEALAHVRLPAHLSTETGTYRIHPVLLDACLQPVLVLQPGQTIHLLAGFDRMQLHRPLPADLWSHVRILPDSAGPPGASKGDVRLYDRQGQLVAQIDGLLLQPDHHGRLRDRIQRDGSLATLLYEIAWQEVPLDTEHAPVEPMLSPGRIAKRLFSGSRKASPHGPHGDRGPAPPLDSLCVRYVLQAFNDLGWSWQPGHSFQRDGLADRLGVRDRYRRLLGRMLMILETEEVLRATPDGWEVIAAPPLPAEIDAEYSILRDRYPAWATELDLLGRCGPSLAAVMRGEIEPLALLFPEGRMDTIENLYRDSAFVGPVNRLVGRTVNRIVEQLDGDRTFRILEIGAGTGGTTAHLLPYLPPERTAYLFTDLSPLFLQQAEKKFRDYPFVRYALLDIEQDPAGQKMGSRRFDLILAANVLHATEDLRQSLDHVRQLLAPGGLLVLQEVTQPRWWLDLTFGLTEGWWKFTDRALRPHHPLLSAAAWVDLLRGTGFTEVAALPGSDSEPAASQTLLLAGEPQQAPSGRWLIFGDQGGVGAELVTRLRARDEHATLVTAAGRYDAPDGNHFMIDPARPDHFKQLLETLASTGRQPSSIVYLWGLDLTLSEESSAAELEAGQARAVGGLLHLVQALLDRDRTESPQLWIGTCGAQPQIVPRAKAQPAAAQATLWGFGRVLALEHPELATKLIDLDNSAAADQAKVLFNELRSQQATEEDQVVWRSGQRYVPRLQRSRTVPAEPASWRREGSYLITGGLGELGLTVARWLAEQGVRHLVLAGRTPLPERALWNDLPPESGMGQRVAAVQAIERTGATITTLSVDVGDAQQMRALFDRFGNDLPPLRGILHAAATIDRTSLSTMTLDQLHSMFRAKVMGTWLLHQLSRDLELDAFILFSSTTALWGVSRMAHYAAANCFLDGMAFYRQAVGLPALSINWGLWERAEAITGQEVTASRTGLQRMPDSRALEALGRLARAGYPQGVVAAVDWGRLKPAYETRGKRAFFSEIDQQPSPTGGSPAAPLDERQAALRAAAAGERYELLLDYVRAEVSHILEYDEAQPIDIHQGLFTIGMDSLMAVGLKARLEALVGESLPTTLTFNYPNIAAIASYLAERLEMPAGAPAGSKGDTPEHAATGAGSTEEDTLLTRFDEELAKIDDSLKER